MPHRKEFVEGIVYEVNAKFKLAHIKAPNGDIHVLAPFSNYADGKSFADVKLGQTVKAEVVREPTKLIDIHLV